MLVAPSLCWNFIKIWIVAWYPANLFLNAAYLSYTQLIENLKSQDTNCVCIYVEYKKRRTGESQAAKSQQEPCGLDALASAAVLGDTIGEPEVATTTRHPRHRAGCSCIVCIQPPSGKGRHKPTCGCTVCSTVKRRFKTLMMRRKKKQLERDVTAAEDKKKKDMELAESDKSKEEKEVNTARIDLNSDPYNKEDAEAVAVEKEESQKRAIGQCSGVVAQGAGDVLGVTELEGEAKKVGEEPRVSS